MSSVVVDARHLNRAQTSAILSLRIAKGQIGDDAECVSTHHDIDAVDDGRGKHYPVP